MAYAKKTDYCRSKNQDRPQVEHTRGSKEASCHEVTFILVCVVLLECLSKIWYQYFCYKYTHVLNHKDYFAKICRFWKHILVYKSGLI